MRVLDLAMLSTAQQGAAGRAEPMVMKCVLQKPFSVGYRADPATGVAVVAEVKGNAAKDKGSMFVFPEPGLSPSADADPDLNRSANTNANANPGTTG